jgi:hypothetical protein
MTLQLRDFLERGESLAFFWHVYGGNGENFLGLDCGQFQHGFILCGKQSTKNTPTWYKTYAIVGVVSIPTYKKCYDGGIFEFPENNGASQKEVPYHD